MRSIFLAFALLAFIPTAGGKLQPVRDRTGLEEFNLFKENGKVGLKNEHGQVLIPAKYEAIGWSNGTFSIIERVVGYQSNGKWGLITTSNKVVTSPEYIGLTPGEGSFLIAKKSSLSQRPSFGIINTAGKTTIPFMYDAIQCGYMRAVVMVRSNMRYLFGLTDMNNKILVPVQYQHIAPLGSLRYAVQNFENKTAIFSDDGNQLTAFDIDSISPFKKNYAVIYQDGKQGVIDRDGQPVLKPVYGEIRLDEEGVIHMRETHQWFMLHGDNKMIAQFSADGFRPLSEKHYAIHTGGKVQLVGNDLVPLQDVHFSSISKFDGGKAIYQLDSRKGVISEDGKVLIEPRYHQLEMEQNGYRACLDTGGKNRWVILDLTGTPINEKQYEFVGPFNGKFYPVRNRGYWGAVNLAGKEIITCVHDSLLQESNDNVVVKFKNEYGVMNIRGQWVVTPQKNRLTLLNENFYLESDGQTTFLKTIKGGLIYFSNNPLRYDGENIREDLPSGAYWIVNMNGIVIDRSDQPQEADKIFPESEGFRAIRKDGKFGFIDDQGRLRIANRYENAAPFRNGFAAIQIRGRWGFIDRYERLVVQPVYDKVTPFNNGVAIVEQDGLFGMIDSKGKVVLPLRYDRIVPNEHGRYIIHSGKFYGMADSSGSVVIHPKYDEVTDPGNGYVIVRRGDRYGVLTLQGVSTVPMIYDDLVFDHFHNHFLALKKSKWEVFKNSGE